MTQSFKNQIRDACFLHLNNEQITAMQHRDGPALVLAVPGSGKTTLMLARTLFLIETCKVSPKEILTMTFSKSAALDLNNRYNQLFKRTFSHKLQFSTIHRYCYGLLRRYQGPNQFTLIEGNAQTKSKRHILAELYRNLMHEPIAEDKLEELVNAISYVKNMMLHKDQFEKNGFTQIYLSTIYQQYEDIKRQNKWIDFDDMLSHALELLQSNRSILNNEQNKYRYIQVDESQDISKIQYEIIKHIAYPRNNLYLVADDDQSIYGFRGACPQIILDFPKVYGQALTFTLRKNYRSSDQIIQICNQLIQNNETRHYKLIEPGQVMSDNDVHPVKIVTAETAEDQLQYVVDHLNRNALNEAAILFRNNLSIIPFIERFEQEGIPYFMRDFNFHFFNHWLVKDIRSFFELAIIPTDIQVLERIYYKMNAYISKKAIQYVYQNGSGHNVFEKLAQVPDTKGFQIDRLKKLQLTFSHLAQASPLQALEMIETELGYKAYLDGQVNKMGFSKEQIRYYFSHLKYIASECKTLLAFEERLEYLKSQIYQSRHTAKESAVTFSTMHGSKGLEFDTVFIIDATDGIIPAKKALSESDKGSEHLMEEERRLFYVSLSRARYKLHVIQTRFLNGEYNRPSPFLAELAENNDDVVEQLTLTQSSASVHQLPMEFDIGDQLTHARFGKGELIGIDGDTLTIAFDDGEIRDLSYRVCAENSLLALASQ